VLCQESGVAVVALATTGFRRAWNATPGEHDRKQWQRKRLRMQWSLPVTEVGGQVRLLQATCMTNRQHYARPFVMSPCNSSSKFFQTCQLNTSWSGPFSYARCFLIFQLNAYLLATKTQLFECLAGFRHDSFRFSKHRPSEISSVV